jgi:hypothetical protein
MFEGEPSVLLSLPVLPWVVRQALLNVPLTNNDQKHTAPGPLMPDFSLQNTCKFAVKICSRMAT